MKQCVLLAIVCWSVLVSLFICEGFLWAIDPKTYLAFNGYKNGVRITWGNEVRTNRFGFREREFEVPKAPGIFRIMVLGDSLTWGAGLSSSERYTNRLERKLQDHFPEKKIEVLNFGVEGGPTTTERDIARHLFDVVAPDLLVVGFCLNDTQPQSQDWSIERSRLEANVLFRVWLKTLEVVKSSGLVRLGDRLKAVSYKTAELAGVIPSWQTAMDRTYEPSSTEWQTFQAALEDIRRLSDSKNLPQPIFTVLNQSLNTGVARDYAVLSEHQFLLWSQKAFDAAVKAGFRTIDHVQEIKSMDPDTSLVLNSLDAHPSAALNEVYAQKLYSIIVPSLIQKMAD